MCASCLAARGEHTLISTEGKTVSKVTLTQLSNSESFHLKVTYRESRSCTIEVETDAIKLRRPSSSAEDDYNEAMPDGSYIQFEEYRPKNPQIGSLQIDRDIAKPLFVALSIHKPTETDMKWCSKKDQINLLFFGKK